MKSYKQFVKESDAYDNDRWIIRPFDKVKKDNPSGPTDKDKPNHVWAPNAKLALEKYKKEQNIKFKKMPGNRKWRGTHGLN